MGFVIRGLPRPHPTTLCYKVMRYVSETIRLMKAIWNMCKVMGAIDGIVDNVRLANSSRRTPVLLPRRVFCIGHGLIE